MHAYIHACKHAYIHTLHTYVHTYINYTTLHYTTLHHTALHYTTLHTTLHFTALGYTLHYTTLHYVTLRCVALHYITLHTYTSMKISSCTPRHRTCTQTYTCTYAYTHTRRTQEGWPVWLIFVGASGRGTTPPLFWAVSGWPFVFLGPSCLPPFLCFSVPLCASLCLPARLLTCLSV